MRNVYGEYFNGAKISDYGLEHGYVDYRTLAKNIDAVMCNDFMEQTYDIGFWEQISGFSDDPENEDYYPDVFQWFITDHAGAEVLEWNNEIIYYNETLDLYLWGVTHFGTSWDYVLTDIKCNTGTF